MSQNLPPLSVGNVVSAGLRIYRDHFQSYFSLGFIAYLWVLIPIYGWAKFSAILGLMSRLVFREVIESPETVKEARRHVKPRMWSFLLAGILVGLIVVGIMFGVSILFGIIAGVLSATLGQSSGGIVALSLLGLIGVIALIVGYFWLVSRLFIVEMPLAIENNVSATSAIGRSWELTQGFVSRIWVIVFVAFLITIPISIAVQIVITIVQVVLAALLPQDSALLGFLYFLRFLGFSIASGALLTPFWQAIKAVIYYDLRNRREGMGVQLRDQPSQ